MAITAEECGELTQRCMKMIRKYKTEENIPEEEWLKFKEELGDVFCMIELLVETGLFDWREIHERADVKKDKLKVWSTLIK